MSQVPAVRHAGGIKIRQAVRRHLVRSLTYELTFAGQAGAALRAQFDDCQVTIGPGTTTLRAVLPDQAALGGLVLRVIDLRLEVIQVLRVTSSAHGQPAAGQDPPPAGG